MNKALLLAVPALLWSACTVNSTGWNCTVDTDCEMGQTCYTNFPGGFCTRGCTSPGEINECGGSTICTESADGLQIFCSVYCTSTDCREGYECAPIVNSTHSACRPKAQLADGGTP
jgi:hypothetical protein